MHLRRLEVINLPSLYLILSYAIIVQSYSQDEIDNAWKKMTKREQFYRPLDSKFGCWPQKVIPYNIYPGFTPDQVEHIRRHIYQIQNRTCLRWVEKEKMAKVKKHVQFLHTSKDSADCHMAEVGSSEGMFGIATQIILGDDCFPRQAVIHEMLHALGFLHEHQRIDRDCYVVVNEGNAARDLQYKIIYDDLVYERWPYDKRSVTHYRRTYFAIHDKDEPYFGLLWHYRLGDSYGWWGVYGDRYGKLTCLDAYKINYRFCGAPDFCTTQPEICQKIEEEEKKEGCKNLYLDIAKGIAKPSKHLL